jgi:Ca2+-binding EF-hand superfamily protein
MRKTFLLLAAGILFLPATTTNAQEEERPRRDGEMRQQMIEEFDADGDGELNDEERQTAREAMRERRGGGGRGEGRGPEGRPAPPDPNALFDEFDADKDGQLSREEFTKLTETRRGFLRGGRPQGGRGPRDSVSREGGDRPGPPPERREFDRQPPLQNQGERPDGPPPGRGEGRRGPRGEGFGPPPGPGGPEGRGPGGPGPEGQRRPDPNRMFDRFDADGDDQLSREEFTSLAERLQEMRERVGDAGQRRGGGRGGEYGPPGRGRPPRPQRPEAASEPESPPPAVDESST